jgi:AcrR family transcriptional regulator
MDEKISTADKILEAGRQLFNSKGFAATSLNDIATAVGISKGNLSYHFPTKLDLAIRLREDSRQLARDRRRKYQPGRIADDYVEHLLFAMDITWNNRFLLRDSDQFPGQDDEHKAELAADFEELHELVERIDSAGMFRKGAISNLTTLTRSIWIVSRYWMDYLRESEGRQKICWTDQERGIEHHFAVLLPCLTATARKEFGAALARAPRRQEADDRT